MDKRYKPKVGQELYLACYPLGRGSISKLPCVVKSVGIKYFKVDSGRGWRDDSNFYISDWTEKDMGRCTIYESKEEFDKIEEERELRSEMFSWFRSSDVNKLVIEDLKSIKEIIDKYKG